MNRAELVALIKEKKSFLCVGLDTDPDKLPAHIAQHPDGVLLFNKAIIDATLPFAVAFKLNLAFYESMGDKGWQILKQTIAHIPSGKAMIIADAKRGDIGNTAAQYGKAFFDTLACDAITVNPYMGRDSITPFLKYEDKWTIVLGLTSNEGADDLEKLELKDGRFVFEATMDWVARLGSDRNLMFVVGATQPEFFAKIRNVAHNHFLLVPGVGAQGGQLEDLKALMTEDVGVIVNSSRKIIYASLGEDFAVAAGVEANRIQQQMSQMLE